MAGIGQRFTSADHSVPWNTQTQYNMGRAMMNDYNKPVTTYGSNFAKRPLFSTGNSVNTGAPSFSDIATLSTSGYSSRPGSSQRNGELISSIPNAFSGRTTYPAGLDSSLENGPSYFNALNYNNSQAGPPRNFSEPSLFPSLSTVSRTAGNELTNNRVGPGCIAQSVPINTAMALASTRNPGNLYSNSVGNENTSNSTNLPLSSSSRGVTLDPSEFPPILTSTGRSGNTSTPFHSSSNQPPLRNYVSIISKGSSSIDQSVSQLNQQLNHSSSSQVAPLEFSKQDFPALPGSHQPTTNTTTTVSTTSALTVNSTSTAHRSLSTSSITQTPASANSRRLFSHTSNHVLGPPSVRNQSGYSNVPPKSIGSSNGIQLLPNHLVTNIPKNMICDQFGMLGLLKLIRVGDYDATLNMLAPGLDLSALHRNWQTPSELHTTFVSPFHDSCFGRPQDIDYPVPPEYLIRHLVTDRLPDPPMNQLSEETLFWLFYNCCREEAQLVVAKELYQREWRFHKKEQIWLTRIVGANFTSDNNSEQGDYYFWDPLKAQKSTHQMTILYSDLDNAPAAFRLSSGTLSAFVSVGLPGGSHSIVPPPPPPPLPNQQQQLVSYQHQSRQPQQGQQAFSHTHHQTLMNNNTNSNNSPNTSGPFIPFSANSLTTGPSINSSAATLASLFNTRQQQPPKQPQQLNSNPNYFSSHNRTAGPLNSLFTNRSAPVSVPVSISNNNTVIASSETTSATSNSNFNRLGNPSVVVNDNTTSQVLFDGS
ncbi:CCR4-NOT transcription complex subunit 2 [Schistosoma japonicum]|uniref:CCR4-NOT transcription complex subunit 2 n=1 Tax=Schistosoma japonicum TaxID=6182 RepID=A0A4Z2DES6_SCHJA|nr:CCR4-NOT transcription complex subunit 2 [Schistosoma japonicum]